MNKKKKIVLLILIVLLIGVIGISYAYWHLNLSQTEIKQKLNDLYKLWDDSLNSVWGYLKANLSTEAMDALTQEEIDWIADKEQDMATAEKQSEEDALTTAIDRTQERVYYLLDRLQ